MKSFYMIVFYELNTNMTGFSGLHVFQLHAIVFQMIIIMVSWGGSRQYYHFHNMCTRVIQKVLPVSSTETLLHIWLSTEYYGFRPSSTAVDTGDTRGLMMSK